MQGSISTLREHVVAAGALAPARFVTFAGAYPAAGAAVYGATVFAAAAAGEVVTVTLQGTEVVEAGGVVTAGGAVKADATGRCIDQGGSGVITGRALTAAAAAGTMVEVQMFPSA